MTAEIIRARLCMIDVAKVVLIGLFASIATVGFSQAAEVKITKPENDKIVMTPSVTIEGTGLPEGAAVSIRLNGSTFATTVAAGKWSTSGVALNVGANAIDVQIGDKLASVLVVRGADDVKARPQQKVRFLWNDGVDDELEALVRESLSGTLTNAQVATFVSNVKTRVVEVFKQRYDGVANIKVVDSDGDDVHTISMLAADDSVFGSSPFDCGSTRPKEISEIHIGTFHSQMTQPDDSNGFISGWRPMKRSDPVEDRTEDVSQAIGRTSAHEFGHSIGLVGGNTDNACRWMDGCDAGHNCEGFDISHPLADRFDSGWHIMDPGGRTVNNARISEPDNKKRTKPRKSPIFEAFSASYLRIVHPPL
jgi:hypothetical protein